MPKQLVSVVVLKERLINQKVLDDSPLFEESIYLMELDNQQTKEKMIEYIQKTLNSVETSCFNQFNEEISSKIVKVIDVFESVYGIEQADLPNEVYHRYLMCPPKTKIEDILSMYYSDYVWENEM